MSSLNADCSPLNDHTAFFERHGIDEFYGRLRELGDEPYVACCDELKDLTSRELEIVKCYIGTIDSLNVEGAAEITEILKGKLISELASTLKKCDSLRFGINCGRISRKTRQTVRRNIHRYCYHETRNPHSYGIS